MPGAFHLSFKGFSGFHSEQHIKATVQKFEKYTVMLVYCLTVLSPQKMSFVQVPKNKLCWCLKECLKDINLLTDMRKLILVSCRCQVQRWSQNVAIKLMLHLKCLSQHKQNCFSLLKYIYIHKHIFSWQQTTSYIRIASVISIVTFYIVAILPTTNNVTLIVDHLIVSVWQQSVLFGTAHKNQIQI